MAAAAFSLLSVSGRAADNPLVGVWVADLSRADGKPYASIALGFDGKGRLQERVTTSTGETFYSGVYSLALNGILYYRLDDYAPKSRCAGSICVAVAPAMPLGQVLTARINSAGGDSFLLIEGRETHVFRRER